MKILCILALSLAPGGLQAQSNHQTLEGKTPAKTEITDGDRFHIRELEARLLQVDNQVKDWQLTGRPEAQKAIQAAYQEAQAACKAGEQLDPSTIRCVAPPAPSKETGKDSPPK